MCVCNILASTHNPNQDRIELEFCLLLVERVCSNFTIQYYLLFMF